ncbi:synaptic plasticity regulator PANTS-like [Apostichopus japonicus]|uniref:synaptic plasticity regulator PANTS-like n=1 Tax=Stichopus japonicus TaxID=307972 RepID=UPI003AB412C3
MAAPMLKQIAGDGNVKESSMKLIRSCEEYFSLWKDCKSWTNKFHEYYVHGEWPVCEQWKEDHHNCMLWTEHQSKTAKEALIQSELHRLKAKNDNSPPVWNLRTQPCSDWTMPALNDKTQPSSKVS